MWTSLCFICNINLSTSGQNGFNDVFHPVAKHRVPRRLLVEEQRMRSQHDVERVAGCRLRGNQDGPAPRSNPPFSQGQTATARGTPQNPALLRDTFLRPLTFGNYVVWLNLSAGRRSEPPGNRLRQRRWSRDGQRKRKQLQQPLIRLIMCEEKLVTVGAEVPDFEMET